MDNPLDRYCTSEIADIWSHANHTKLRMRIWLDVLQAQYSAGIDAEDAIDQYRRVYLQYDGDAEYRGQYLLYQTRQEAETRHETVAALNTFEHHAGNPGKLHLGLTSSDISENTQQLQIRAAASTLAAEASRLSDRFTTTGRAYLGICAVGRTHNRPAQPIRLADRYLRVATGLRQATKTLTGAIESCPIRGLGGAVGNNRDMLEILNNSKPDLHRVRSGFTRQISQWLYRVYGSGSPDNDQHLYAQCYPRGWDLPIATGLLALIAPLADFAITTRLMAGHGLATETREELQIGSSAMPHKTNPILAERIHGLQTAARGYHTMIIQTAGEMWNEGDISDSSTRRIAWPGLTATISGILDAAQQLLDRLHIDTTAVAAEYTRHAAEINTGVLLARMVRLGMNRETAHATLMAYTADTPTVPVLARRIDTDPEVPMTAHDVAVLLGGQTE